MSAFLSKLSAKDGIINNGAESEVTSGLDSKMEKLDRCVRSCSKFRLYIGKTCSLCPKFLQVQTLH